MIPGEIDIKQVVLERLRFAVTQEISEELAHTITADVAADQWFHRSLLLRLERAVYAHRTHVESRSVPVHGRVLLDEPPMDVLVELPRGFWRWLFRRPARKQWLPAAGRAWTEPHVIGTADVRAEYFSTFPDSTLRFPDSFGPIVAHVQTGSPENVQWRQP